MARICKARNTKHKNKSPADPKRPYRAYAETDLQRAVDMVQSGWSFGKASKACRVTKSTVINRDNGRTDAKCKPGRKCDLDVQLEKKIVTKIIRAADAGFPYTTSKLLAMIGHLVKKKEHQDKIQ